MFPSSGLALDVGAGSGRDARWLRSLGMSVVAVEPAAGFRRHASAHPDDDIRWVDDRLPSLDRVHRLGLGFDLILLSAVWQHVAPVDRQRSFRKLATLLKPGGVLAITLRSGPSPSERPMHGTSAAEVEALARSLGLEILKVEAAPDLQGRADVTWLSVAMRMPDDGTSALPLIRGIVLGDDKSSTYKLGLLRAVARVAEHAPGAVAPATGQADAVELPLGLIALFWIRMYIPLVRLGLPQAPNNRGPDGLGFAKNGFRRLLADGVDALDLRVGAVFDAERGSALVSALSEAASTIANMPANFTRFPNSDRRVFEVVRGPRSRAGGLELTVAGLRRWGAIVVPGGLWRALSRHGPWVDPMLVAEWARLTHGYADRMSISVEAGKVEAALEWREPARTTAIARLAVDRILAEGRQIECVWTGRPLSAARLDVDHCLPWAAWPCGDLWNLGPCDPRVNRHEKRDRLPSAALLSQSRERIMQWWQDAYLSDPALATRFGREASGSLPVSDASDAAEVFVALDWRRLRLAQDQQLPEWSRQLEDVT